MRRARRFLERAAGADVPVLVLGETGTGKSHFARLLHSRGRRAEGRLVAVNCAGLPEALFESELFGHRRGAFTGAVEDRRGLIRRADRGTLFLDEVGELPPSQQAKLLTVLEEGRVRPVGAEEAEPVDVRLVSATARELPVEAGRGGFRLDLYHRIALLRIVLPPLRDRPEDLEHLVAHFSARLARKYAVDELTLTSGAREFLRIHSWPGNIRELTHALEAALVLSGEAVIRRAHLKRILGSPVPVGTPSGENPAAATDESPGDGASATPRPPEEADSVTPDVSDDAMSGDSAFADSSGPGSTGEAAAPDSGRYSFYGTPEEERAMIEKALARNRGNRTRTARELGMARGTLRKRMRRYGLEG